MEVVYFSTHRMLEGLSREVLTIQLKDFLRNNFCSQMNVEMQDFGTSREDLSWYVKSPNGVEISFEDIEKCIEEFKWWPITFSEIRYVRANGRNILAIEFKPVPKGLYIIFKQRGLFE